MSPAGATVALLEFLEQKRQALLGNARTGVVNGDRESGLVPGRGDADPTGFRKLHRVAGEVDQDLAHPVGVTDQPGR